MKGLLIKDFRLLMGQKQFFMVVLGMVFIFSIANSDPTFGMTYVSLMLCMFTISTISYDEYDNGGAFLFSLPITRKLYVTEKYVYGILLEIAALLMTSIWGIIVMAIKNNWKSAGEFGSVFVISFCFTTIILGVMIPAQLKFGAEKSRIALMGIILGIFGAIYLVVMIAEKTGIAIETLLLSFSGIEQATLVVLLCGAGMIIMAISYMLSLKIMKKKEY